MMHYLQMFLILLASFFLNQKLNLKYKNMTHLPREVPYAAFMTDGLTLSDQLKKDL